MVQTEFENKSQKVRRKQHDPDAVFSRIALAVLSPENEEGYKTCCYGHVAAAMQAHFLKENDEIVLLGFEGHACHGIVVREGRVVVDSLYKKGYVYDDQTEAYQGSAGFSRNGGFKSVARLSYAEFMQRYSSETLEDVPAGRQYPAPAVPAAA